MSNDLPILDSCDGCGACCFEQESPPGYVMLLSNPDGWDENGVFAEDLQRLRELPIEAMHELREYLSRLLAGEASDDRVCLWLDRETLQCRYYEHRPSIRREFELNSEDCHGWRRQFEIDGD